MDAKVAGGRTVVTSGEEQRKFGQQTRKHQDNDEGNASAPTLTRMLKHANSHTRARTDSRTLHMTQLTLANHSTRPTGRRNHACARWTVPIFISGLSSWHAETEEPTSPDGARAAALMWDHAEHTWCFVQETSSSVPGPLGGFSGLSRRMAATALWSHSRNGWQSLRQGFKAIETSRGECRSHSCCSVGGSLWSRRDASESSECSSRSALGGDGSHGGASCQNINAEKCNVFFLWFVLPSRRHV